MRKKIRSMKVREIRELLIKEPAKVQRSDLIIDVLRAINDNPISRHAYVVDPGNRLCGSIRINSIINYLFPFETFWKSDDHVNYLKMFELERAEEIMEKDFFYVNDGTTLPEMIEIMMKEKINELPVVNSDKEIIGEVNIMELIKYISEN